jgi:formylmethanofuran:tetrahydromethanopterin formyltransferase
LSVDWGPQTLGRRVKRAQEAVIETVIETVIKTAIETAIEKAREWRAVDELLAGWVQADFRLISG